MLTWCFKNSYSHTYELREFHLWKQIKMKRMIQFDFSSSTSTPWNKIILKNNKTNYVAIH